MAFLAPFIAAGIADLGIAGTAAEAASSVGLSEGLSATVGSTVQGAVAGAIGTAIGDVASSVVDRVFGSGTVDSIQNNINNQVDKSKSIGSALINNNYDTFLANEAQKRGFSGFGSNGLGVIPKRQPQQQPTSQPTQQPQPSVPQTLIDNTSPLAGLQVLSTSTQGLNSIDSAVVSTQPSVSSTQPSVSSTQPISQQSNQPTSQQTQDQNTLQPIAQPTMSSLPFLGPVLLDNQSQQSDSDKIIKIANDLGPLINDQVVATLSPASTGPSRTQLNSYNDYSNYLSGPLASWLKTKNYNDYLPNNDLFRKIFNIYDGRRLIPQSVHQVPNPMKPGLSIFGMYEEDGNPVFYYEEPLQNRFVVRPIWPGHIWTGPNSPNNALPVDLWDAFSFGHDQGWQQFGNFDRVSDYKYISRLVHGLQDGRFPSAQVEMIKNTIIYFSTVGNLLSMFNNDPTNRISDSQFEYNSTSEPTIEPNFVNFVDPTIDMTDPENIQLFKVSLINSMTNELATSQPIQQITTFSQIAELQQLENLQIQLI